MKIQDHKIFFSLNFLCVSLSFHLRTAPTVSFKKQKQKYMSNLISCWYIRFFEGLSKIQHCPNSRQSRKRKKSKRKTKQEETNQKKKQIGLVQRFSTNLALAQRLSMVCN